MSLIKCATCTVESVNDVTTVLHCNACFKFRQAELEGACVAIKALLHMAERAKPTKLIGALAWVENDEYARKLAADVLNKQPADHSRLYEELTTLTQQLAAREGQVKELKEALQSFLYCMNRWGEFDDGCFYYNRVAAPELTERIALAQRALKPSA